MPASAVFEIATPWLAADLSKLRYEQTADVAVLACYGYPAQRLRRFAHNDWRMDEWPTGAQIDPPSGVAVIATNPEVADDEYVAQPYDYAVTAVSASGQESEASTTVSTTNDLSLKGDYNTISWTAQPDAIEFRIYGVRSGVYGFIGRAAAGEVSFKDDNILSDFSIGPPSNEDPFADGEYPSTVALHESRLFAARTPTKPSAIFGSKSDDIFNFDKSSPLQATDSIALAIRGKKVNPIQHLASLGDALLVLTADAIAALIPTSEGFLSPLSLRRRFESRRGAGPARPDFIDDILFYCTARGGVLRSLGYTFEKDGYKGNNLSIFASHFFQRHTLTHIVYCEEPSSVLWCLRDDGVLLALTWQQEQDVWGWTLCETAGAVESICCVSENGVDTLYATVRRVIGGVTRRYVERMTEPLWIANGWDAIEDACIVDAAVIFDGNPTTTLSRIDHLSGPVSVLADGYEVTGRSIVNGSLTPPLTDPASKIILGLPYSSYITTLPVVSQVPGIGSTKGNKQLTTALTLELLNSSGLRFGIGDRREVGKLYDLEMPIDRAAYPPPLFSSTMMVEDYPVGDWSVAQVTVRQDRPLPMVVLSLGPSIEVSSS